MTKQKNALYFQRLLFQLSKYLELLGLPLLSNEIKHSNQATDDLVITVVYQVPFDSNDLHTHVIRIWKSGFPHSKWEAYLLGADCLSIWAVTIETYRRTLVLGEATPESVFTNGSSQKYLEFC